MFVGLSKQTHDRPQREQVTTDRSLRLTGEQAAGARWSAH